MRVEYLIDGYNFLMAHTRRPLGGVGNLAKARDAVVAWIARRVPDPGSVTIVFDASKSGKGPDSATHHGVQVLYATGYPSADALIAERCQMHSSPRQLVVVSDDREVRKSARRRRANVLAVQREFPFRR